MNKCKTCKFWDKSYNESYGTCHLSVYSHPEMDLSDENNPKYLDVGACGCVLNTGPYFGCVLWEGKDEL